VQVIAGRKQVTVSAPGKKSFQQYIEFSYEQQVTLNLCLVDNEIKPCAASLVVPDQNNGMSAGSLVGIGLMVAGGAAVVSGGVLGVVALFQGRDWNAKYVDQSPANVNVLVPLAVGVGVGGGALFAAGLTTYLLSHEE
jgi:hypothetical protein